MLHLLQGETEDLLLWRLLYNARSSFRYGRVEMR